MASDRIICDASKQLSKMVLTATDRILDSYAEMNRIKLILDAATTGGDYVSLAAELGLTDLGTYTSAQQAQDLWTIFSNATARITDPSVTELKRMDQG